MPPWLPIETWPLTLEEVKAIWWESQKLLPTFAGCECIYPLYPRFLHELMKVINLLHILSLTILPTPGRHAQAERFCHAISR